MRINKTNQIFFPFSHYLENLHCVQLYFFVEHMISFCLSVCLSFPLSVFLSLCLFVSLSYFPKQPIGFLIFNTRNDDRVASKISRGKRLLSLSLSSTCETISRDRPRSIELPRSGGMASMELELLPKAPT